MKQEKNITILTFCIIIIAVLTSATGIFSNDGVGAYAYQSIRGETIQIYGKGIYKHMSAEVAPQGIAQDYVTVKFIGGFLIFGALSIAFLWLNIVVPPLLDGTIIPKQVAHYTTLIVQGLDLGLLHPIAVVSGFLLLKKTPFGYLMGTTYFIFLSLLMTALCAKIIAMGLLGYNIIPVIFIIPTFTLMATGCSFVLLKNIEKH